MLIDLFKLVGTGPSLTSLLLGHSGLNWWLQYFSDVASRPKVLQVSQYVSVESSVLTHHRPYS